MKKGSKLYSILREKCPHCHEGDFFAGKSVFNLKQVGKVHDKCPECNRPFHKEPGFYYGAMYVSYGLGVAMFVASFIITWLIAPESGPEVYVIVIIATMLIFGAKLYKLSRIIWANMFFPYKGGKDAAAPTPAIEGEE